jgi:hypothetical protein
LKRRDDLEIGHVVDGTGRLCLGRPDPL